jgi:hypothetical protein
VTTNRWNVLKDITHVENRRDVTHYGFAEIYLWILARSGIVALCILAGN